MDNELSEIEANQDDCAANPCLRPPDLQIDWIQCNNCELWFHMDCIGVDPELVKINEDFICKNCTSTRSSKSNNGSNQKGTKLDFFNILNCKK